MKGVVKYERGDGFVELRDIEDSEPGIDQVKIRVEATGICGSDLHILHDTINFRIRPPVIMGHEFSGVVVEVGKQADDKIRVGDRVTGEPTIYRCGKCDLCLSGFYNLCSNREVMGYYHHGSFAPFCNATLVHKLPDNVGFEAGAMTELLACCVHSVIEQGGVRAGDFVAITGPGPVGLLSALVAKAEGGSVLLCGTTRDQKRLELALELGIDHTIDIDTEDPIKRINDLTGGYGADVVIECAGVAAAIDLALNLVRKRGSFSQVGLPGFPVTIDFEKVAYKELRISGGIGQRRSAWKRALRLMEQNAISCEKLVSHQLPLNEWERAFDLAENQEGIKVMLRPEAG